MIFWTEKAFTAQCVVSKGAFSKTSCLKNAKKKPQQEALQGM